jgi:DNA recombination protein RmuC
MELITFVIIGLIILAILILIMIVFALLRTQLRINQISDKLPGEGTFDQLSNRLNQMDNTSRASFERLAKDLGGLSEATRQMMKVGETISSLEDLLKPPKLRGGMGETLLEELLSQILPIGLFEFQYTFRSGVKVDAIIRLGDSFVPVDAKFPLESFRRIMEKEDKAEAEIKK